MILIGKAHHDSSGEAPLTPTFRPMEPHLIRKVNSALKTLCANMTETSCVTAISEQGGKENQHGNDEQHRPSGVTGDGDFRFWFG